MVYACICSLCLGTICLGLVCLLKNLHLGNLIVVTCSSFCYFTSIRCCYPLTPYLCHFWSLDCSLVFSLFSLHCKSVILNESNNFICSSFKTIHTSLVMTFLDGRSGKVSKSTKFSTYSLGVVC